MRRFLGALTTICIVAGGVQAGRAALPDDRKEELYLFMKAAVDRDCDGQLEDESPEDRNFDTRKSLAPYQCVFYRTEYRNDGSFGIRHLRVTNQMPAPLIFIPGSAEHIQTPPGLWPQATVLPDENSEGALIWRFGGALAPGEEGALQFRARLMPPE